MAKMRLAAIFPTRISVAAMFITKMSVAAMFMIKIFVAAKYITKMSVAGIFMAKMFVSLMLMARMSKAGISVWLKSFDQECQSLPRLSVAKMFPRNVSSHFVWFCCCISIREMNSGSIM